MEYLSKVKAEELLEILASGSFPMAEDRFVNDIHIITPKTRAILPLPHFHCPKRLARVVRQDAFEVRINYSFERVIRLCAARPKTWINQKIIEGYSALHKLGHAHSIETWQDDRLVGGLYGVVLGGVFFGESMFSKAPQASKVALVHLVARMRAGNFTLLDLQFMTTHLRQFGAKEITAQAFNEKLALSKKISADFLTLPDQLSGSRALQEIGHIS